MGIVHDDVFCYVGKAASIQKVASKIATVVFEAYTEAGLKLHLHQTKTCALVSWQGEGKVE